MQNSISREQSEQSDQSQYVTYSSRAGACKSQQNLEYAGTIPDSSIKQFLTEQYYSKAEQAITRACSSNTRGQGGKYRSILRSIPAEVTALIVRTVLQNTPESTQAHAITLSIGQELEQAMLRYRQCDALPEYLIYSRTNSLGECPKFIEVKMQELMQESIKDYQFIQPQQLQGLGNLVLNAVADTGEFLWSEPEMQGYSKKQAGYLYVLRSLKHSKKNSSCIKVGITNKPEQRLQKLKRCTPFDWELLYLSAPVDATVVYQTEQALHSQYSSQRRFQSQQWEGYSEWLLLSPAELATVLDSISTALISTSLEEMV